MMNNFTEESLENFRSENKHNEYNLSLLWFGRMLSGFPEMRLIVLACILGRLF